MSDSKQVTQNGSANGKTASKKSRKIKFLIEADAKSQICLAGTFNDWNPESLPMKKNGNGMFSTTLLLPPGRHEYKFVVNGQWHADPKCMQANANSFGSANSVVEVA